MGHMIPSMACAPLVPPQRPQYGVGIGEAIGDGTGVGDGCHVGSGVGAGVMGVGYVEGNGSGSAVLGGSGVTITG